MGGQGNYRLARVLVVDDEPDILEIAELNFKRLLVAGRDDELVQRTINPTERPALSVQSVDIQAAVGIPGPTLSHHLDILRRAGLVQSRREARFIYCSANHEFVTELVRLLSACC